MPFLDFKSTTRLRINDDTGRNAVEITAKVATQIIDNFIEMENAHIHANETFDDRETYEVGRWMEKSSSGNEYTPEQWYNFIRSLDDDA